MRMLLSLMFFVSSFALLANSTGYQVGYVSCSYMVPSRSKPSYMNLPSWSKPSYMNFKLKQPVAARFASSNYAVPAGVYGEIRNFCKESLKASLQLKEFDVVGVDGSTSGWPKTFYKLDYVPVSMKDEPILTDLSAGFMPSQLKRSALDSVIKDRYLNKKRVALVMFHGTASNQRDAFNKEIYFDGEIISSAAAAAKEDPSMIKYLNYVAIDGVGSGNNDVHLHAVKFDQYNNDIYGKAFGTGITGNIESVISTLNLVTENPNIRQDFEDVRAALSQNFLDVLPDEIVVIGWSRGGMSAIQLANKIYSEGGELAKKPMFIYAIDPVAGGLIKNWRERENTQFLPPNVKKYVSVIFEDERSALFDPTIPEALDPKATKVDVKFLPGNHAMGVGNSYGYADLKAVSMVNRHMLAKFLRGFGFSFVDSWLLSELRLLKAYLSMEENRQLYKDVSLQEVYTRVQQYDGYRGVYHGGKFKPMSKIPEYSDRSYLYTQYE